ncbi:NTP transferase domain-containing protein [bacterium]|nr:NTP transferase domain-containing protein [bacterium]
MLHTVVMAGGSGTRFWPVSRKDLPKQFLSLFGAGSLIQQAVGRCRTLASDDRTWIVTGAAHAVETGRQLPGVPASHILVEPCGRNTAPCIGLAALCLLAEDPDAVMLVTPADHVIQPETEFVAAVERAVATLDRNPEKLCLFGIVPDRPATGYGYIERGEPLPGANRVFDVVRFREKPNLETAQDFLEAGNFLWNSGIFVWRADTIVRELERTQPELIRVLNRISEHIGDADFAETLEREFPDCPSISIDYAVLEHSRDVCVLEAPFGWDDVGSWSALARLHPRDEHGNTVLGQHVGIETENCTIFSSGSHLVTTIGLHDCVVVHTDNATLVAKLDDEAQVKELLKAIEAAGLEEFL